MPSIVLHLIPPEKYFEGVLKIVKGLGKTKIIYVTTNKPYRPLTVALEKIGVSSKNLFVVDCISKQIGEKQEKDPDNCVYLEGPQGLTLINISINECLNRVQGEKVLLLDSLSTLLLYNDASTVGKFTNFLVGKLRSTGVSAIILALESDMDKDVLKQIESFADDVKRPK